MSSAFQAWLAKECYTLAETKWRFCSSTIRPLAGNETDLQVNGNKSTNLHNISCNFRLGNPSFFAFIWWVTLLSQHFNDFFMCSCGTWRSCGYLHSLPNPFLPFITRSHFSCWAGLLHASPAKTQRTTIRRSRVRICFSLSLSLSLSLSPSSHCLVSHQ